MPPKVALAACIVGIFGLMWLDRDDERRTSRALWIPIVWLAIASSRMLSQWLSLGTGEFDSCLEANRNLSRMLGEKGIQHWLDVRPGAVHDWPLWRETFPEYLSRIG